MGAPAIVDSHVHLCNPAQLRYPWLEGLPALNRAFLPADFLMASAAADVQKIVFVESGGEAAQSRQEVAWVSSLAKGEPRIKGIIAHAALELGEQVQSDLEALADEPLVKGVRRLLQGESDLNFCLQPKFIEGVKRLEQFGFTFDLCIRAEQLPTVTELVQKVPGVTFILDHCGKPKIREKQAEPWAAQLKKLAALPNVVCKISGLATEADHQCWQLNDLKFYLKKTVEAFGFDRVLFGSDWPVATLATTYDRWLMTVSEFTVSATEAERMKLFQTNAERIYRV